MPNILTRNPISTTGESGANVGVDYADLADSSDSTYGGIYLENPIPNDGWASGDMASVEPPDSSYRLHRYRVLVRGSQAPAATGISKGAKVGSAVIAESTLWSGSVLQKASSWVLAPVGIQTGTVDHDWEVDASGAPSLGATTVKFHKLWAEYDYRFRPTMSSLKVHDRAGNDIAPEGTITDTRHPRVHLNSINRDGLTGGWTITVTDDNDGDATVWTKTVATDASSSIIQPIEAELPDGDYTVSAVANSTVGDGVNWDSITFSRKITIAGDVEPTFTADVLDATDTSKASGTIDNTNRPKIIFKDLDLKGLDVHSWSVEITGPTPSSHSEGEIPDPLIPDQLVNGEYTATLTVNTTDLGTGIDETLTDSVTFTVDYEVPNPSTPTPLLVTEIKFHVTALPRRRGEIL